MIEFSEFIGIDWSGSQDYSRGSDGEFPIQIAICDSFEARIELHQPRSVHNTNWKENRWSRTTAFNWLVDRIQLKEKTNKPALIGFDFALSFPYADFGGFFPKEETPIECWESLLTLIRTHSGNDFDPTPFIDHVFYSRFFMLQGKRGSEYSPRNRITEQTQFLRNQTPANIYKLIGGDQVGRGSISGLAMIQKLREQLGNDVFVWPFDGVVPSPNAKAVIVEVWPRMLYEMVGVPPSSHRYPLVFNLAMKICGVGNVESLGPPVGENSGDALLTAAALRHFYKEHSIWRAPEEYSNQHFAVEGWIWGAKR